ncbi:GGDEF domain-containing protein [Marispirochaeta sp.]|jgi:diguanylate cyclase (GGDEF)-like protein|uniref:GGDEF domain-containing protein n=1 Tax=Marispirochaeta sp. TaxID=2038653 RepID=UPI0029C75D3E|nr:GGDEF domain-containing protein [Marispirochaeta sp.]
MHMFDGNGHNDNEITDPLQSPDVLPHYDLLDRLGVIDEINRLKTLVIERNDLLGEATVLFTQTEIPEIARTAAGFLVNKFVPRRLSFIYSPDGRPEVTVLSFRNMKEDPPETHLMDLSPFDGFFAENIGLVRFSDLRERLKDPVALEDLDIMDPELVIPVKGHAGLYGMVVISEKIVGGDYNISELAYVDRLMSFVSIAMQNSIHYSSSVTDSKTRLYNTAFIQSEIEEEISRIKRYGGVFSILMIDLDFFKRLNDKYGHLAGDLVLKEVAAIIGSSVREGDVAARFGGEEFLVLLHSAGACDAYSISERLRRTIEARRFFYMNHELRVTASIGCVSFNGNENVSREDLTYLADKALYRSKQTGRNTTSIIGSGLLFRASNRLHHLDKN